MSDRPETIPGLRLLEVLVRILARLHPAEFRTPCRIMWYTSKGRRRR